MHVEMVTRSLQNVRHPSVRNVIESRENMECIIRDDAYLSSNTVTALQKERFVFLYFKLNPLI